MEEFYYGKESKNFIRYTNLLSERIGKRLHESRETELRLIEKLFNIEYEIANQYVWIMLNAPHIFMMPSKVDILLAAFHKNLLAMYSSLSLTKGGFYGSARIIFRHIFEYLMIAKFSSLSEDEKIYESWKNKEAIYFANGVLKKIKTPDNEIFKIFWNRLNEISHASRTSLQLHIDWDSDKEQIESNLVVLQIFLECNYHLLNTHVITDSMKWNLNFYFSERYEKVKELKKDINELFAISRKMICKQERKIIHNYKKKWNIE